MIPVRRSNQLSYEATDVGSGSFVGSKVPVMNESMNKVIYKMNGRRGNVQDLREFIHRESEFLTTASFKLHILLLKYLSPR